MCIHAAIHGLAFSLTVIASYIAIASCSAEILSRASFMPISVFEKDRRTREMV